MIWAMKLYFQKHATQSNRESDSKPKLAAPVVLIPGLFGSTRNWRAFAQQLSEIADVYVIDQRNHGESPHSDSHSYADMVADLLEFIDTLGVQQVHLVGHSMGGKVGMTCAIWHPERVLSLSVLDIAPVVYTHSHAPFLSAMLEVDVRSLSSRNEADRLLAHAIPDKATRLFLLQSLSGSPGAYAWRLNLQVLHDYMGEIIGFPISPDERSSEANMPVLFIRGALSAYLSDEHQEVIQQFFPKAEHVSISAAGHWLHVEQPAAVLSALESFLLQNS